MAGTRHFAAADLVRMPDDGQRYEVVDGELLVTPAPGGMHQPIVTQLLTCLLPYLMRHGLSQQLLLPPADITLSPDTLVQPDILVADTAAFLASGRWTDVTTLLLVVEVLSPSTARADRVLKRSAYQRHRVPQYWIVDRQQRQVEVWTPEARAPRVETERLTWRHPAVDPECMVDLVKLFAGRGQ